MDIVEVFTSSKVDIALRMWRDRFELKVGMISMVMSDYRIEIHRLTETDFVFVFNEFSNKEITTITDKIRASHDAS